MARKKDDESSPERPYKDAKAKEGYFQKVEARQPDQIPDYHEKNPTLKPSKAHEEPPPSDNPPQE